MSDPKFNPISYIVHARDFGRRERPEWKPVELRRGQDGAPRDLYLVDQLRMAQIQNKLSFDVRTALASSHSSATAYAKVVGVSAGRLGRVLRGEALIRIEDVVAAERVLGIQYPALPQIAEGLVRIVG